MTSGVLAVLAVVAAGRGRPSPLDQVGGQLRAALGLSGQQTVLLRSVARSRCGALAELVEGDIGRRAQGPHRESRSGPTILAAAAAAVANEVDGLLSSAQRVALERFEPRVTLRRDVRRVAKALAAACRRAGGLRAADPTSFGADMTVAAGVEEMLCRLGVPAEPAAHIGARTAGLLRGRDPESSPDPLVGLILEVADGVADGGAAVVDLLLRRATETRLAPAGGLGRRRRWLWELVALTPLALETGDIEAEEARPRGDEEKEEMSCDV